MFFVSEFDQSTTCSEEIYCIKNVYMYSKPPNHDIHLEDLQNMCWQRYAFLQILNRAHIDKYSENQIISVLSANKLYPFIFLLSGKLNDDQLYQEYASKGKSKTQLENDARLFDKTSHFLLRLAYCRSPEQTKWFVERETQFFQMRFRKLSQFQMLDFLDNYKMNLRPICGRKKKQIARVYPFDTSEEMFKVKFTQVLDLVKDRKVYLKKGFAYISGTQLVSYVSNIFKKRLQEQLSVIEKCNESFIYLFL